MDSKVCNYVVKIIGKKKLILNFDIDLNFKFINEIRNFVWAFFFC